MSKSQLLRHCWLKVFLSSRNGFQLLRQLARAMQIYPTMIIQSLWQIQMVSCKISSLTLEYTPMLWICIKMIWLSFVINWRLRYLLFIYVLMLHWWSFSEGLLKGLIKFHVLFSIKCNSYLPNRRNHTIVYENCQQVKYVNAASKALQKALSFAKLSPEEQPVFIGIHCRYFSLHKFFWPLFWRRTDKLGQSKSYSNIDGEYYRRAITMFR